MSAHHSPAFGWQNGLRYGAFGLPLAFLALPLYVLLPNHYANAFGMPLATLGAVLLAARLFDALVDPVLGRWVDRLYAGGTERVLWVCALASVVLCTGFAALFFPPTWAQAQSALIVWALGSLALTYLAYSTLSVAHQAWAARLGGTDAERSRIVAWREGFGLLGVVLASVLPVVLGYGASVAVLCGACALAWVLWRSATRPGRAAQTDAAASVWLVWQNPAFRRLFAVFVVNGIASAVPATLLLFFVQDRLQAKPGAEGPLLAVYFVCAAVSLPLWLKLVGRIGLARSWGLGMGLAVAVFVSASLLGAGQLGWFGLICALSGAALGADLAVPSALLARVVAQDPQAQQQPLEGVYFGWWNFATKLNLALAAGLALPLLALFGYTPGARDPAALQALTTAYCLLPCALKLVALAANHWLLVRTETSSPTP